MFGRNDKQIEDCWTRTDDELFAARNAKNAGDFSFRIALIGDGRDLQHTVPLVQHDDGTLDAFDVVEHHSFLRGTWTEIVPVGNHRDLEHFVGIFDGKENNSALSALVESDHDVEREVLGHFGRGQHEGEFSRRERNRRRGR